MPSNPWKAISFGPRLDIPPVPRSASSLTAGAGTAHHARVPTTRDVKNAYRRRQNLTSTATGVYTIHPNPASGSSLAHDMPAFFARDSSPARAPSPDLSSTRCSSPQTWERESSTPGWSSDYPDPASPSTSGGVTVSTSLTQWTKWTNIIIPALIGPYLALMRRTDSLGNIDRLYSPVCICQRTNARVLIVTCVYFDGVCSFLHILALSLTS